MIRPEVATTPAPTPPRLHALDRRMADMPLLHAPTKPAPVPNAARVADAPAPGINGHDLIAPVPDDVARHLVRRDPEIHRLLSSSSLVKTGGLVDVLFHQGEQPHLPDEVFDKVRWGGLFVYASRDEHHVNHLADRFAQRGWLLVHKPDFVRRRVLGLRLPLISPKLHYFVARKVYLIRPREVTERFTYQVQLVPDGA